MSESQPGGGVSPGPGRKVMNTGIRGLGDPSPPLRETVGLSLLGPQVLLSMVGGHFHCELCGCAHSTSGGQLLSWF